MHDHARRKEARQPHGYKRNARHLQEIRRHARRVPLPRAGPPVGDEALTAKDAKSAKRLLNDHPRPTDTCPAGNPSAGAVVDLVATESENAAERGPRREEVNVSELTDE